MPIAAALFKDKKGNSNEEESTDHHEEHKFCENDLLLTNTYEHLVASLDANTKLLEHTLGVLQPSKSGIKNRSSFNLIADKGKETKREDKVIVEVKVTFIKINDIDTVNQLFEAEILVRAKWIEPMLKGLPNEKFNPGTMWTPDLVVMNIHGDCLVDKSTYKIIYDAPGYDVPLVVMLWRFKGFFQENLELQHFPIDVQDLTISLTSERSEEELDLIADQSALSSVNTKTFMDAQEWDIYEHVETYQSMTTLEYASSETHPIFHAQCRVKRKVGYFLWNIVFIVGIITVLTFATYSIEASSADRLGVEITLLLTNVAYMLVVKQLLPTISYLTYLDLYVLAALVFMGLSSSQNAIMKHLSTVVSSKDLDIYDNYSLLALAIIFISFHVIFGVYVFITAIKRRHIMKEKDKIYKRKRQRLEQYGEGVKTEYVIQMSMSKIIDGGSHYSLS